MVHTILSSIALIGTFVNDSGAAITAIATMVIAAFTIVLAIVTGRQARLTKEALIADKRAFVFAININPLWEIDKATGEYHWRLRATWKNSGETPTRHLRLHVECELRNSPLPTGFNFNSAPNQIGTGLLPPGSELPGGQAPKMPAAAISPQDIIDVQNGRKFLYFWGWARYFDVFPKTPEHITRFCWSITAVGNPKVYEPTATPGQPGSLIFHYVHHMEGNCADDECK